MTKNSQLRQQITANRVDHLIDLQALYRATGDFGEAAEILAKSSPYFDDGVRLDVAEETLDKITRGLEVLVVVVAQIADAVRDERPDKVIAAIPVTG